MRTNILLIVDDEDCMERLFTTKFRHAVRRREVELLFASDGRAALASLDARPDINVIFTDLNMPGMDGITLLQQLKTRFAGRAIIITAYGDYDRLRQAMNEGAFDFLSKPLDFADLEATLQRALESQRAITALLQRLADKHAEVTALEKRNAALSQQLTDLRNEVLALRNRVAQSEQSLTTPKTRLDPNSVGS